jgi:hypothetical protein
MSASTVSSALYSGLLLFLLLDGYRAHSFLGRLFCQSQIAKALCLSSHRLACLF